MADFKLLTNREITYWAKALSREPAYGWTGNIAALARVLGYRSHAPSSIVRRRARNIDWPVTDKERLRFSLGVARILRGEVVLGPVPKGRPGFAKVMEQRVNPPRPPRLPKPDPFYIDWLDLKLKRRT